MIDIFYTGKKPNLFAHEKEAKDLDEAARLSRTRYYWFIYGGNNYVDFDFDWKPAPWESEHIHVFPSQWQRDAGVYFANKDTVNRKEWHFRTEQSVTRLPADDNWVVLFPDDFIIADFDKSWHPDPHEPPYIYHFSSQHQSSSGLTYQVPGSSDIKISNDLKITVLDNKKNWHVPEEIDESTIDFSWHPNPIDPLYIYHFSSDWQVTTGLTYTLPGATEIKIIDEIPYKNAEKSLKILDIFFIDKGNPASEFRFNQLKDRYPNIQKVRYVNSILATISRCCNRSKTTKFWIISSENNYKDFDFSWHPPTWQNYMTHVFPSQWNKWSETFLINKLEFVRNTQWAKKIEEFPNLNFVSDQFVQSEDDGSMIVYVNHGNNHTNYFDTLQKRYPKLKVTRFVDNYLDTLKRIVATADTSHIWVINSICDYTLFDFTWQPEPWQAEMIHVFPSVSCNSNNAKQKYGDTFYINVESFKTQMYDLEILDWFNVINYCDNQTVPRLPEPVVTVDNDSLIDAVMAHEFNFPYAMFIANGKENKNSEPPMCLWRTQTRAVQGLNSSNSVAIVPRDVKNFLKDQIYDYPYIIKSKTIDFESMQDVIFISNGESMAEKNWEILKKQCPRAKRSTGITGRERAYKAAAELSNTPWFYAVFAKTEVLPSFNFDFMPDYFQQPKHYIFHSRNPLNGLEYGAMNINLYNKKLVLDTDPGLDFTLSQRHAVIPECISISRFNTDPWITWRSAFREVLKLKREVELGTTIEIKHRLDVWCAVANGENAEYCLQGAQDAIEYYKNVKGDYEALRLSFDWEWCQNFYFKKYNRKIWLEVI